MPRAPRRDARGETASAPSVDDGATRDGARTASRDEAKEVEPVADRADDDGLPGHAVQRGANAKERADECYGYADAMAFAQKERERERSRRRRANQSSAARERERARSQRRRDALSEEARRALAEKKVRKRMVERQERNHNTAAAVLASRLDDERAATNARAANAE